MTDPIVTLTTDLPSTLPSMKGLYQRAEELRLKWWLQANDTLVTRDSAALVSLVTAKIGSGVTYAQTTAGQQPLYVESQFGKFPGLKFDGVDDRLVTAWTGAPSRSLPWSVAVIFRIAAAPAAQGCIMASRSATNVGSLLYVTTAGVLGFQHGAGVLTGPNLGTLGLYGKTVLVIFGSDGDNLFMRVNGRDYASVATDNAAATVAWVLGALNTSGGQPFAGVIGDVHFTDYVINNDSEVVEEMEAYAARFMKAKMAWQS